MMSGSEMNTSLGTITKRTTAPLIDDMMARAALGYDEPHVCTPRGLVPLSKYKGLVRPVDLGWAHTLIPVNAKSGRPKNILITGNGYHYIRYTGEDSQLFYSQVATPSQGLPENSEEYFTQIAYACGLPSLRDFEDRLRTLDGSDLCAASEYIAAKRAKARGRTYSLPTGWFLQMYRSQRGLCAISKLPMYREGHKLCHKMPVPDRIDCSKGYEPENVRLLRHGVNMMRKDMDDDLFISICESVASAPADHHRTPHEQGKNLRNIGAGWL